MPDFLYLIHPLRHGFYDDPTPEENAAMERHFQYLREGDAAGRVLLAGPCLDETFGLVLLRLPDEAAARAFMFADPAVKENVMMAELHPVHISLVGKTLVEGG